MYVLPKQYNGQKVNRLKELEQYIYQMAIKVYKKEMVAVEVTKQVLLQLWQDVSFFELKQKEQQKRLVWLVCQKAPVMS